MESEYYLETHEIKTVMFVGLYATVGKKTRNRIQKTIS